MSVIFAHGFEDEADILETGIRFGYIKTYETVLAYLVSLVESTETDGTGRRSLRIHPNRSSNAAFHDRGLGRVLDFSGEELWFGCRMKVLNNRFVRVMYLLIDGLLRFSLNVDPTTSAGSIGFFGASSAYQGTATTINTNTHESGPGWAFNPEGQEDPSNPWRFVVVHITRRANDGDVTVYVDGIPRVAGTDITGLAMSVGNITLIALNGAGESAISNDDRWVGFDDFWIATEPLDQFRVFPTSAIAVGSYEQATPSEEQATPSLFSMINEFPTNIDTHLNIAEGDAVSIKLDDSFIADNNANNIAHVRMQLSVGGPANYVVFLKDGASEIDIGSYMVGGISPEEIDIELFENPITEAAWTVEDISNVEVGIRNDGLGTT